MISLKQMDESKSKEQQQKGQRRFNQEQYDFLKKCSEKGEEGIKEWNEWREKEENRYKDIELEGAPLGECYLKDVHLHQSGGYFLNDDGTKDTSRKICSNVYLKGAHLNHADLKGAGLMDASLEGAKLWFAHLEGADLSDAHLENAEFQRATVDGSTSFWECKVDCKTNFLGVALDVAKIDPATKQLLEYNIRRKNWKQWYKEHTRLKWLVKPFWWMSDYGLSTGRIIGWFFLLALGFAAICANCACWWPPGIVNNLDVEPHLPLWHYFFLVLLRPIYFSIVTMTTLGFGDMHANVESIWGHVLLTVQVVLGYVLLGALVTRFAVLFTAGGPAGKFADEKKEKATEDTKKNQKSE